jgi:serine/threonine protein kinase
MSGALDNIWIGRVNSYKEFDDIGVGAFGNVWKVRHRRHGKEVAIKPVHASKELLLREATLLTACVGNPTVVFQEVVHGAKMEQIYLIKEYIGRSLHCVTGTCLPIN